MTDKEVAMSIVKMNKERISDFLYYDKIMYDDELNPMPVSRVARLISDVIEEEFDLEEYVIRSEFPTYEGWGDFEGVFWTKDTELSIDEIKTATIQHYNK